MKLAGLITENQEKRYNLIKQSPEGEDYLDTDLYEKLLRSTGIEIDEDQLEEFLDELMHGGYTGSEYRNVSVKDIQDDYTSYFEI